METTVERTGTFGTVTGRTDHATDVLADMVAGICARGDRAVRRLCAHVGARLVDGFWVYLENFGTGRICTLPSVGGWYLYDSVHGTYLEVDLDGDEVPVPTPLDSFCDLDAEGCSEWNRLVPTLASLGSALEAAEADAWGLDEDGLPTDSWDRWLADVDAYGSLYRLACERAVRAVVAACDGECGFWDSGEGEAAWAEGLVPETA